MLFFWQDLFSQSDRFKYMAKMTEEQLKLLDAQYELEQESRGVAGLSKPSLPTSNIFEY